MTLVGRILVVVAVASAPAVVTLIGCGVQGDRYPGLPNEVPNGDGTGSPTVSGSSSSSGSSTSSASSSSGGPTLTICQCAYVILTDQDAGACNQCGNNAANAGGNCQQEATDCTNDPTGACQGTFTCISNCTSNLDTCVAGCLQGSPVYQKLATCQCSQCQSACIVPMPLACDLGGADAGADADDGSADAPSDG